MFRCYWGFHSHFSREAEHLFNSLESSYQKALQSHLKNSDSIVSLPQSDRSSSSSQESLNRPLSAKRSPTGSTTSRDGTTNKAEGRIRTRRQSSGSATSITSTPADTRGRSRAKVVSQSQPALVSGTIVPKEEDTLMKELDEYRADNASRKAHDFSAQAIRTLAVAWMFARAAVLWIRELQSIEEMDAMICITYGSFLAGSRSSSPGKLLGSAYGGLSSGSSRGHAVPSSADKRSKVPRSQGCSRETSPNRIGLGKIFHNDARSSRIPRPSVSQGCSRDTSRESSRDTSPARGFPPLDRFGLGQPGRLPASMNAMRVLSTSTDLEAAVADALVRGKTQNATNTRKSLKVASSKFLKKIMENLLISIPTHPPHQKKPVRRRYEPYGMYSDDDANSDASSACSERSYGSRNGGIPHYLRQTEDVAEVLNHCASSNWSERKEGLIGLQNLLKSQRTLSRVELKRLCEIFTRMFADPHSKVFSMFLETLVDFIIIHKDDLQDWLFVLLTQLLKKMGADLLGSVQAKVQKALDVTRDSFPFDQQFNILMRFIVDQTQTPNLKVKVAILKYIESLARQMDPTDFVNSSEAKLAVSRIITWTTEPKSSDVRKTMHSWVGEDMPARSTTASSGPGEGNLEEKCKQAAQIVLISLFELNTPEFTMLLGALPKTFQDGATRLLHNHLKNSSNTSVLPFGRIESMKRLSHSDYSFVFSLFSFLFPLSLSLFSSCDHCSRFWGWSADGLSKHPPPLFQPNSIPAAPSHKTFRRSYSPSMLDYDTENLNSDEIYSSLRGVTEAIEKFSFRSQEDLNEPIKRDGKKDSDIVSRDGGVASPATDIRGSSDVVEGGRMALDNKTSLLNTQPPRAFSGPRTRDYNPYPYSDTISAYDKTALKEAVFDDDIDQLRDVPIDHSDLVADLLKELSNHNERVEERKGALLELLKITREDNLGVWEEHFKTILLLLLETLGDKDHSIRALALRVLREILRNQPARFKNYAELTIMKTLEAHKDSHKEVVRAAEEAASTLASSIHPEQCIKVLCPIIQTADYPINLAAIKMQTKGYDNTESSVRKASVFCLVAIYSVIGEELKPHLAQLTGSKMKLLNLYIKRAQTTNSNSSSSSDVSTHS
ncbi:hypothetical protein JD844_022426 [Phrynosoma platyrhinos]|uniref:TOG domain-containing protein n=1 Tax=Phrynosoma platyrhinos TaxID=52577 RepID=A0ABQ7SVE5_PHRPL|nr:hypothetical protein JD844_022426 [Phrynosoma platyrhinos]